MEGQGEGNPHIGVLVMQSRKGGVEEVRLARKKASNEGGRECGVSACQTSNEGCMDTHLLLCLCLPPSPSPPVPPFLFLTDS